MLSEKQKDAVKNYLAKFGIDLPAKKVDADVTKLEDVKLIDGTILSVDKMEVGAGAKFTGADGVAIPAEGSYELEDGTTVVCAGGLITEIKPKEDDAQPKPNAEMAAILSRLEAIEKNHKATQTTLEAQLSETKKSNEELKKGLVVALSSIDELNTTAVSINLESQKADKVEVPYEKMTKRQQMEYNRNK